MSTQVQFRRGNTAQTASFTGAIAEITVDTDKKVVVVHDGTTAGGYALARESSVTANNQLSQAAFNTANAAFLQANTPSYTANSASTYANGAFVAANTADAKAVTSGSYANSAFIVANTAAIAANTPSHVANSAAIYANGAFATANNEAGVNLTQNNSITASFSTANSASIYANGAFSKANNEADVNATQNNSITAAFTRANNSLNANSGGVITGPVTVSANLTITGNLTVVGNTITTDIQTLNISDPLIYLAANNYSGDAVEIGFAGNYYDGSTQRHTGVFRESSNKQYYIFDNYTPEPDANLIDINDASFRIATLNANIVSTIATIGGVDIKTYVDNAFAAANAATATDNTQNNSITAAFTAANSAGVYANGAFATANNEAGVNLTQNNSITAAFNTANSAFVSANGTAIAANTPSHVANSAAIYANGAFVAANTADAKAVTSGSYANSAFATANNEAGVNATQNNSITAAFTTANSAGVYANGAFAKANTDVTGISAAAGTYGSSSTVPIVTLEANGRISSVTTTTIVASDPSAIAFAIALG